MAGYWALTRMDRRRFLKLTGQLSAAATLTGLLAACQGGREAEAPAEQSQGQGADAGQTPSVPPTETSDGDSSEESASKTLPFVWLGDMTPLWHPAAYHTFSQAVIFSLIFSNLVKLDDDLKTIIPDLADDWEISSDATEFTFHLNQNATWHDGTPFTAKDVVFSFTRQIVEPYRYTKFMTAVKGAEDYEAGKADRVEGIEQVDDYTVRITLNEPDVIFLLNLTEPGNVIVPEHVLADVPPEDIESTAFAVDSPVGTGPYKFVQYVTDQYVEFDVYEEYFKGRPEIDKLFMKRLLPEITVAQLESGEVDLALRLNPAEYERVAAVDRLNVISQSGVGMVAVYFPTEQPRVSDKRVRQGIYYAIDRKGIVEAIYQGRADVLKGAPPALDHYDDLDPYEYDPDKARQLLEEAGFDFDAPFRIIYDQTYPAASQYYPVIQQQLMAIGVNVQLEGMDSTAFIARTREQRDSFELEGFYGGAWGLGPHMTGQYFDCTRPDWGSGYQNCDFDALFEEAKSTADPEERDEVYHEIARIFNEDVPILPLWMPHDLHAATKQLGGGFTAYRDPRRTFSKVETWTLG